MLSVQNSSLDDTDIARELGLGKAGLLAGLNDVDIWIGALMKTRPAQMTLRETSTEDAPDAALNAWLNRDKAMRSGYRLNRLVRAAEKDMRSYVSEAGTPVSRVHELLLWNWKTGQENVKAA